MSAFKCTAGAMFILFLRSPAPSFGQVSALALPSEPSGAAAGAPTFAPPGESPPPAAEATVRSSSLIRMGEQYRFAPGTISPEGAYPGDGVERKIYLLQLESGPPESRELLRTQQNLLKNQLAMIRVLGILGEHHGRLGQRMARMENIDRETFSVLKDTARSVDSSRLDTASNLVVTQDVSEISQEINREVIEIQKQLEDIEVAIDGLAETTEEVLSTVESIQGGMGL